MTATALFVKDSGAPSGRTVASLRHAHRAATWTVWVGVCVSAAGFTLADPAILAGGAALLSSSFVLFDVAAADRGRITPITFYAFSSAITGVANFVGLNALDGARHARYFFYASYDDLLMASVLAWWGAVLPVLGFWLVTRRGILSSVVALLPPIRGAIGDVPLLIGGTLLALAAMASQLMMPLTSLGTIAAFFHLMPHFAVFTIARAGAQGGKRLMIAVAFVLALVEAVRALLFAYLRSDILFPFIAFTFGIILGRRSLRALVSPSLAPIWLIGLLFVTYFGSFGYVRGHSGAGLARLVEVQELQDARESQPFEASRQTLLARLTSFNQLSQIGRLVRENGHLDGGTFEYLGFALIPRFLWPEKPLIAKGSWFAATIGQAYTRPDGSYSNSVNMTVVGELFLNFGWPGVLLGLPLFGMFLAVLWLRTFFWEDERNVLGGAFAFYLLWIGFGLAADLQILVTLTAIYLLFAAASAAVQARHATTTPSRPAWSTRVGTTRPSR